MHVIHNSTRCDNWTHRPTNNGQWLCRHYTHYTCNICKMLCFKLTSPRRSTIRLNFDCLRTCSHIIWTLVYYCYSATNSNASALHALSEPLSVSVGRQINSKVQQSNNSTTTEKTFMIRRSHVQPCRFSIPQALKVLRKSSAPVSNSMTAPNNSQKMHLLAGAHKSSACRNRLDWNVCISESTLIASEQFL